MVKQKKIQLDSGLSLFLITLRYLAPFIPVHSSTKGPVVVPFTVKVASKVTDLIVACEASRSWRAVYESHPAVADTGDEDRLVTVVTGSERFYEAMAFFVQPLGKLGAG